MLKTQDWIMRYILFLLASFFVTVVSAEPYVGLGIGSTSYDVVIDESDFEEDSTGTKLYAGYTFNDYFAAEATLYDFAKASVGSVETFPGSGMSVSASARMKGLGAYAVGMYPVSKEVNLIAKIGVLNWDADLELNDEKGSNDGTDVAYAIAASYAFTKELSLLAEWEAFDTDNPEVSLLSVGFRFDFR